MKSVDLSKNKAEERHEQETCLCFTCGGCVEYETAERIFKEIDKICEKDRSGYIDSPEEDIINDLGELKKRVLE